MDRLIIVFDRWSYRNFAPAIEGYASILLERVAPLFDDVGAEQERAAQSVMDWSGWDEDDYEMASEAAWKYGNDAAIRFMEMRSLFLATGVSGLFHLFEKQIYSHLNKELREWLSKPIDQWRDVEKIISVFRNRQNLTDEDLSFITAFQDRDLVELKLVANAVKHGEGNAYSQLKNMNAVVVDQKRLHDDWTVGSHTVFGVNLSVNIEDVKRYRDSILKFWSLEGTYWAPRSAFKT